MTRGSLDSGLKDRNISPRHSPGITRLAAHRFWNPRSAGSGLIFRRKPAFTPPLHLIGTDCQIAVWKRLNSIPYGTSATYGEIGKRVAAARTGFRPSPQAVGGIVSQNPISIIIPSHRVVPANGSLTGYAGGVIHRARLLMLEKPIWGRS